MSLSNKLKGFRQVQSFDNRWSLTLTKLFFPAEKLQIYRYRGLEILADHAAGDANGAREVLTTPMYSRFLSRMRFQKPINLLDLGANNGGFPLMLLANGIEIKKVVSVEFNPNTFNRLRFNLERNLDAEVVALNAALCGDGRDFEIKLGKGSVSDSIYENGGDRQAKNFKIRGMTFDEIYENHFVGETIDLCKIDVEGAEFEVFGEPAHQNLSRCCYLIMEIHETDKRKAVQILPELERLGLIAQPFDADADPTVYFFINPNLEKAK